MCDLSYKWPDDLSHKALVGLWWHNLKPAACSLIVRLNPKSLAELKQTVHNVEGVIKELEDSPKQEEFSFPTFDEYDQSSEDSEDTLKQSQGETNQENEANMPI